MALKSGLASCRKLKLLRPRPQCEMTEADKLDYGASTGSQSKQGQWLVSNVECAKASPTSNEILVQAVHFLNIGLFNDKISNSWVLDDTALVHALRQWHVAMLKAPPYHKLCRRAIVLLRKRFNGWILHLVGSRKRRIRLDCNVMRLAV